MKKYIILLACCLAVSLGTQAQVKRTKSQTITTEYHTKEVEVTKRVKKPSLHNCFFIAEVGTNSAGYMMGFSNSYKPVKWGGYISMLLGYGGMLLSDYNHIYEGEVVYQRKKSGVPAYFQATAGVTYRLSKPVYIYGGLGYGNTGRSYKAYGYQQRYSFYDDIVKGKFTHSTDGLACEIGCLFRHKRAMFLAGLNFLPFTNNYADGMYADIHVGVGFNF